MLLKDSPVTSPLNFVYDIDMKRLVPCRLYYTATRSLANRILGPVRLVQPKRRRICISDSALALQPVSLYLMLNEDIEVKTHNWQHRRKLKLSFCTVYLSVIIYFDVQVSFDKCDCKYH